MRLIDADKIKIESRKHCINCTLNGTKHCKTCVINLICDRLDLQPTVELTETEIQEVLNKRCMSVVTNEYLIALHGKIPQGEWLLCEDSDFSKCSICGVIWLNEECNNYCPNCGADMRGNNNGKK